MSGNKPYPTAPAYPTQGDYMQQAMAGYPQQPIGGYLQTQPQGYPPQAGFSYGPSPVPSQPSGPPPPYGSPAMQPGYPSASFEPPPPYGYPYAPAQSTGYPQAAGAPTMYMPGAFDAGARFDGIAQPVIPPAPPGCAPNPAQLTAMQGSTVITSQQKANWFSGGSGGGTSWGF